MLIKIIGMRKRDKSIKVLEREAVRAVVVRKSKVLMIESRLKDCIFPGGGVEVGENHEMAVKREVLEETGYSVIKIKDYFGQVMERRPDLYEKNQIFEMVSHYYICDVGNEQIQLQLEAYERDLNYKPVWMSIDKAIKININLIKERTEQDSSWLHRELFILNKLKDLYN